MTSIWPRSFAMSACRSCIWFARSASPPLFSCCSIADSRLSICCCRSASRWLVASIRCRASSSGNSAAFAPPATRASSVNTASIARALMFGLLVRTALHATSPRGAHSRPPCTRSSTPGISASASLSGVDDVIAAVLGPGRFVVTRVLRLLLAERDGFDLAGAGAQQHHHALDGIGALLPERDVVFARAALVGVALDRHPRARMRLQVARVRLDEGLVLVLDDEAVEVEVDAALGEDAVGVVQF